jgi:hypothetical protein
MRPAASGEYFRIERVRRLKVPARHDMHPVSRIGQRIGISY